MKSTEMSNKSANIENISYEGSYTNPRSYGVYYLQNSTISRRYRFGNHPIRMRELEREFSSCALIKLFLSREDAKALAYQLNQSS